MKLTNKILLTPNQIEQYPLPVSFLEWVSGEGYSRMCIEHGHKWFKIGDAKTYTTMELYGLFIKEIEDENRNIVPSKAEVNHFLLINALRLLDDEHRDSLCASLLDRSPNKKDIISKILTCQHPYNYVTEDSEGLYCHTCNKSFKEE